MHKLHNCTYHRLADSCNYTNIPLYIYYLFEIYMLATYKNTLD